MPASIREALGYYELEISSGLVIVTKDRGDLVSVVVENYSTLRPLLLDFARAGDDAQVLLELIRSAESRMAVAMVKGNPPEDDGDREPVAT